MRASARWRRRGGLPLPGKPTLRSKSELRYTGSKVPRVDLGAKVRGEPVFSSDIERPGMVYACAVLSSVYGAELEGFERESVAAVPGVLDVVAMPGGAAVIATHSWAAMRGAEALKIPLQAHAARPPRLRDHLAPDARGARRGRDGHRGAHGR